MRRFWLAVEEYFLSILLLAIVVIAARMGYDFAAEDWVDEHYARMLFVLCGLLWLFGSCRGFCLLALSLKPARRPAADELFQEERECTMKCAMAGGMAVAMIAPGYIALTAMGWMTGFSWREDHVLWIFFLPFLACSAPYLLWVVLTPWRHDEQMRMEQAAAPPEDSRRCDNALPRVTIFSGKGEE